jgi:hypothetical protein
MWEGRNWLILHSIYNRNDSKNLNSVGIQNKVLRTTGNQPRRIPTRDLHMAFKISYLYDFVTKPCMEQATVILNHEKSIFASLAKAKLDTGSIKGSNLVAARHTIDQLSGLWTYP